MMFFLQRVEACVNFCLSFFSSAQLDAQNPKHQKFFPRQLFVLRSKSKADRETDEWAGKVKAIVKAVDANTTALKADIANANEKIGGLQTDMDDKFGKLQAKVDDKISNLQEKML